MVWQEAITAPAIFICLGYSAPENGNGGVAIGFKVNTEALSDYKTITGKENGELVFEDL